MTRSAPWIRASREFFNERAISVASNDLESRCFVSGRDPRVWADQDRYDDLIDSIVSLTETNRSSRLLEVGCATGFLAVGLSSRLGAYTGVDVAAKAVHLARSMNIKNCSFEVSSGDELPYTNDEFDSSILYDVVTNFPEVDLVTPILREMARVTRPGGIILIGSVPDSALRDVDEAAASDLASRLGPTPSPTKLGQRSSMLNRLSRRISGIEPSISCYYHSRQDFIRLGDELGLRPLILPIHPLNPYARSRFNAVFRCP